MAGAMKASLTLELIDKISAPAKAVAQSLRNIGSEAKKASQEAVSTNVETLKKAGEAAAEKARKTGEGAKEAAKKAVEDTGKAIQKAEAAATKPAEDAAAKAGGLKDHFKKTGDAPVVAPSKADEPNKAAKAEAKKDEAKKGDDKKDADKPSAKRSGKPTALADLQAGAGMAAHLAGDLVGKASQQAKKQLQSTVTEKVSAELGALAGDFIAKRTASLMEPVRGHLNAIKEQYPILAPMVDKVGGKIEHVAALASGAAQKVATKAVSTVATKAGLMAAGLVGLPGLAIGAGLAVLTQWSKVKTGAQSLFNALPAPAQAAMKKVGQTLAQVPLLKEGAKAFDQFGNYVEGVFKTLVNGGPNQMQKLREQLVDQPKQWASDMASNIGQAAGQMWDQFKTAPKASILHGLDVAGNMLKSIPKALGNVGVDLAESLTGMDLSGLRGKVDEVVEAFFGIPNKLADLGGRIFAKISEGDWTGAATTLATGFANILLDIPKSLGGLANELGAVFTGVNLKEKAQQIADDFVGWLQSIPGRLGGLAEEIKGKFNINLFAAGQAAMETLKSGLMDGWASIRSWAANKAKELGSFLTGTGGMSGIGAPAGGGGKASPPGRAHGGPVRAGGLYKVGEHGEELFVPAQDGSIVNASDTRRLLSPAQLPPSAPYATLAGDGAGGGARLSLDLRGGAPATAQRGPVTNHFAITLHAGATDDPETMARRFWAEAERQARGGLYDGGAA